MLCMPMSKAGRRYTYRLAPTMALYVIFLFIAQWTFHHLHPSGIIVYLLAVLPALPLVGSLAIVGLYIAEESDEFERSIIVQSMLWGLAGAPLHQYYLGFPRRLRQGASHRHLLRLCLLLDLHGYLSSRSSA